MPAPSGSLPTVKLQHPPACGATQQRRMHGARRAQRTSIQITSALSEADRDGRRRAIRLCMRSRARASGQSRQSATHQNEFSPADSTRISQGTVHASSSKMTAPAWAQASHGGFGRRPRTAEIKAVAGTPPLYYQLPRAPAFSPDGSGRAAEGVSLRSTASLASNSRDTADRICEPNSAPLAE